MPVGEAEESRLSGSVEASAGDLLTTVRKGLPAILADSGNGPLAVLGEVAEAEEAEKSRLLGSVDASAGGLLTTMCRESPAFLASEIGPLTVLGEAEEAMETRPPGATLLVILGSKLQIRGYPGCASQGAHPLSRPIVG